MASDLLPANHITIISFDKTIEDIANFNELPRIIREEIRGCRLSSHGFQEILGHVGRDLIFSLGGHWEGEKFQARNYGSKAYQWDGKVLRFLKLGYGTPTPSRWEA